MANINETIAKVAKLDPDLARQIRKYVHDHNYGLVFEHNLPEAVRLYTKTATVGDTVNIRPDRGEKEKDENKVAWNVKDIKDGMATIENGKDERKITIEDLVPIVSYHDVIYPGLREVDRIERGDKDDPYQVVINSENYHALEMLTYCYAGKADCIYIDPPYNTGAKDWKYNNDYVDGNDQYRHSKWLAFMERRLKLAKSLLNPKDSVLIVTIDEKECTRLGMLLEQMFPEANIQMISSTINLKGVASNGFARCDEYIYCVMLGEAAPKALELNNVWAASLTKVMSPANQKMPNIGWSSMMRRGANSHRTDSPGLYYAIYVDEATHSVKQISDPIPSGKHDNGDINGLVQVLPIRTDGSEGRWQVGPESFKKRFKQGRIRVGSKTSYGYVIQYLADGEYAKIAAGDYIVDGRAADGSLITHPREGAHVAPWTAPTQWKIPSHDASAFGSSLVAGIIGHGRFSFPKSLYAVHDVLRFFVADKPNALIVDFFAGSGTTLHAINLLNAEDGGKRRCVCVTNNEVSVKEQTAFVKCGLRPGDEEWESHGIARYVTWPRTKCSIEGVDVNGKPLKGEYGCMNDSYEPYDADVLNPDTGKKVRGKAYKKTKKQMYPEMDGMRMSDGLRANAIFFDLTYESAWPIRLDNAFDAIAPILWMQAGCKGPIIHRVGKSYLLTDYYGVLFDYGQASKFVDAIKKHPNIKTAFVVTDDQRRYSNMCRRLPDIGVHRLYESFLKTFEIFGEGGLD
ncbi:site-specific DNA-methyltransferase [Limosilactobacillus fermentum]|uniref:site-specific DNA-methyltransferase n=1 Tax=Limosilactobacillus fermentum TaxID=1613 RepID=UPI0021A93CA4|nr:DNA methyltransferase [Limosilactobacillus fermentum]MCT2875834.1 site-specific DNA-methyltransferase [Limosilactobacillus fermentum]